MLRNQLRSDIWSNETLQGWAWDPTIYSQLAGGALYTLMAREFAPLPDRLRSATARMEKLPALFAQMHANLDPARVPKIHAETVSKQNKGVLSLVDGLIMPHAGELPDADKQKLEAAVAAPAQGRRRAPDLARQDARAEREGRFPHRREAVRREARVRAELAARSRRKSASAPKPRSRARAPRCTASRSKVLAGKPKAPPLPDNPSRSAEAGGDPGRARARVRRSAGARQGDVDGRSRARDGDRFRAREESDHAARCAGAR